MMTWREQIEHYAARNNLMPRDVEFITGVIEGALKEECEACARIVLDGGDGKDRLETAIRLGANAAIVEAILARSK